MLCNIFKVKSLNLNSRLFPTIKLYFIFLMHLNFDYVSELIKPDNSYKVS